MGTVFQIGLDGIEAINGVEIARSQDDTITIESGAIIDAQPSPPLETKTQTRTFAFGSNGLEAMLTEDGITDLSTEDGQVAVIQGADVTVTDIPGYTNGSVPTPTVDPSTPTFT